MSQYQCAPIMNIIFEAKKDASSSMFSQRYEKKNLNKLFGFLKRIIIAFNIVVKHSDYKMLYLQGTTQHM